MKSLMLILSGLSQAITSRSDLNSVSLQVLNNGPPGSLIGAAYSTNGDSQLTYDVPLRDSGKIRNASGSYPWRIDLDYSTVVAITNIGSDTARFQVEIRYPGGPYSIKQRKLGVGETATFDLRQMRDEQQPDRVGKTLPRDLERGQFHWSLVNTLGEPRIIGRAEVVSISEQVVSSYSCPTCCPDSSIGGVFDPNAYGLFVDGYAFTNARGEYYDCYGNWYTGSFGWYSMWTDHTNIATVNASTEELHGKGAGETQVAGSAGYVEWFTDGMDCYSQYYNSSDSAPVDVAPAVTYVNASIPGSQAAFETVVTQSASLTATTSQCNPSSSFVLHVTYSLPEQTNEIVEVTAQGFGNTSVRQWNVDQDQVSNSNNFSHTPPTGSILITANNKNGGQTTGPPHNAIQINVKGKYNSGQTFSTPASVHIECP